MYVDRLFLIPIIVILKFFDRHELTTDLLDIARLGSSMSVSATAIDRFSLTGNLLLADRLTVITRDVADFLLT